MIKYNQEEMEMNNPEYELVIGEDKYSKFYGVKDKDLDDLSRTAKKIEKESYEWGPVFKSEIFDWAKDDDELAEVFESYIENAKDILGEDAQYDSIILEPQFGVFVDRNNDIFKYILALRIPDFKYKNGDFESGPIKFSDEKRRETFVTSYIDFRIGVSIAESKLEGLYDFEDVEKSALSDIPVCKIVKSNQPVKNYWKVSDR